MNDFGLSTLEQYSLTVQSTSRTRGALLVRTDQAVYLLREFHGSEKKLAVQQELLLRLKSDGCLTDPCLENNSQSLVTRNADGVPYTLREWYDARECDPKSREDILKSVRTLARIHTCMRLSPGEGYCEKSLTEEYVRHNRELRRIRRFIRASGASGVFEKQYLSSVEWFLEQGEKALALLNSSDYERLRGEALEKGTVCHGEFTQHNVLLPKDRSMAAVTNFGHWCFGIQISDLYCFMRKLLEKYNWNLKLARKMLQAYNEIHPITPAEWENLKIRFTYPEKYWKLSNYYYTHNKAWISGKNIQKLKNLTDQREAWAEFPEKCFGSQISPLNFQGNGI